MINKHHRKSVRWNNYDYSREGSYFITINTKDKFPYFGEIRKGILCLSNLGQIAYYEWLNTLILRKNIDLGCFVIMPNHIHAVVFINQQILDNGKDDNSVAEYKNKFGPQRNNLASVVRGYKASCTKQIQLCGTSEFAWQPRFHDRVIRNYEELIRIEEYMYNNISNWKL